MGVHTTFVRSVDLDEWTQRQIDSMRLGGNANAQAYFRKAGMTDMHAKIEKKYTSKAAQSYRSVLAKMVDAEAAKRGEAVDGAVEDSGKSLLEALSIADRKEQEAMMMERTQVDAAPTAAKATLASQNPNAKGTLRTPPTSGNAPILNNTKLLLRKPSGNSVNILKKKPSNVGNKLRVNKLTTTTTTNNTDEVFEDVEATQNAVVEADKEAKQAAEEALIAKRLEPPGTLSAASVTLSPKTATIPPPIKSAPAASPAKSPLAEPPKTTLDQGMAKLKAMNSDFFSMA